MPWINICLKIKGPISQTGLEEVIEISSGAAYDSCEDEGIEVERMEYNSSSEPAIKEAKTHEEEKR